MTTARRAAPKPAPKQDEPSVIEQLADDAVPTEYPDGAPGLKPYLAIRPRSKRAAFKRRLSEYAEMARKMQARQAELPDEDDDSDEATPARMRLWADMDDLYQIADDLLRMAALDDDEYSTWSDEVSDEDLMTTFNVYQSRTQPGEASSSAG